MDEVEPTPAVSPGVQHLIQSARKEVGGTHYPDLGLLSPQSLRSLADVNSGRIHSHLSSNIRLGSKL
jgi:hypothetical protein